MQKEENKAVIGDKEILESEMTPEQQYLANQITDLRNKKAKLSFDMDQIEAALNVFQNTFIASTKEEADKKGIKRYGFFYVPMDDCLSRCAIDFSGRPELVWNVSLGLKKIGDIDTELFHEFFKSFSNEAKCNLHIENLYGKNNHHIIESCFKAFAKSVKMAVEIDQRLRGQIPSSKGTL